jgi:hypothetical protein
MLPLFMPAGVSIDKLLRAQLALILFAAAYLAEVVRGGLQAIPRHQYEASEALGLSYWKQTLHVILPQALRFSIPPLVNTFIGFFKGHLAGADHRPVRSSSAPSRSRCRIRRGPASASRPTSSASLVYFRCSAMRCRLQQRLEGGPSQAAERACSGSRDRLFALRR